MSGEEDTFDIDIYGDRGGEEYHDTDAGGEDDKGAVNTNGVSAPPAEATYINNEVSNKADASAQLEAGDPSLDDQDNAQKILSTDDSGQGLVQLPKQAPQTQGLKRKDGTDDRPLDPGATSALMISELHWWVTDDDVRGWANQSECEDELEEVTFSEHKINGKSKGQAYTLFKTPQAATAMKHTVDSFGEGQHSSKKFSVIFTNPYTNPFKTTPKDGAMRNGNMGSSRGGYNSSGGGGQANGYNSSGGYRGRGGYNNRGGMNNNPSGGYNRGGYQGSSGGYNSGGFQNNNSMGGGMGYGGFNNRGGGMMGGMRGGQMGSMRGGRGGMPMNMGMPNMGMGGMPAMGMAMPNMGMPAFQTTPQYNSGFFGQQQMSGSGDASWNPHGAKRTRQE